MEQYPTVLSSTALKDLSFSAAAGSIVGLLTLILSFGTDLSQKVDCCNAQAADHAPMLISTAQPAIIEFNASCQGFSTGTSAGMLEFSPAGTTASSSDAIVFHPNTAGCSCLASLLLPSSNSDFQTAWHSKEHLCRANAISSRMKRANSTDSGAIRSCAIDGLDASRCKCLATFQDSDLEEWCSGIPLALGLVCASILVAGLIDCTWVPHKPPLKHGVEPSLKGVLLCTGRMGVCSTMLLSLGVTLLFFFSQTGLGWGRGPLYSHGQGWATAGIACIVASAGTILFGQVLHAIVVPETGQVDPGRHNPVIEPMVGHITLAKAAHYDMLERCPMLRGLVTSGSSPLPLGDVQQQAGRFKVISLSIQSFESERVATMLAAIDTVRLSNLGANQTGLVKTAWPSRSHAHTSHKGLTWVESLQIIKQWRDVRKHRYQFLPMLALETHYFPLRDDCYGGLGQVVYWTYRIVADVPAGERRQLRFRGMRTKIRVGKHDRYLSRGLFQSVSSKASPQRVGKGTGTTRTDSAAIATGGAASACQSHEEATQGPDTGGSSPPIADIAVASSPRTDARDVETVLLDDDEVSVPTRLFLVSSRGVVQGPSILFDQSHPTWASVTIGGTGLCKDEIDAMWVKADAVADVARQNRERYLEGLIGIGVGSTKGPNVAQTGPYVHQEQEPIKQGHYFELGIYPTQNAQEVEPDKSDELIPSFYKDYVSRKKARWLRNKKQYICDPDEGSDKLCGLPEEQGKQPSSSLQMSLPQQ